MFTFKTAWPCLHQKYGSGDSQYVNEEKLGLCAWGFLPHQVGRLENTKHEEEKKMSKEDGREIMWVDK